MSKEFFRYIRGELNGFYLQCIQNVCNKQAESIKEFLNSFAKMTFKTEAEVTEGELPVDDKMLKGLESFTGIFPPRVLQDSITGSLRFTTSKIVGGKERSERGLYNMEGETFNFVHTEQDDYSEDINTLANSANRSSLVENGRYILGYAPDDKNILDENGNVNTNELLPAPRAGHSDYPYYGAGFLYLAEESPILAGISNEIMVYLIRAIQWVKYNGMSISSLCELINILCPSFLLIDSIEWEHADGSTGYGKVIYHIDENIEYENKLMRINTFLLIVRKKFPQFVFEDGSVPLSL